jgi:hypothetical protein
MSVPRVRRAQSRTEFEQVVDDLAVQGYAILWNNGQSALLRRNTWGGGVGHVLTFLLTFWCTFGVGNVVYAFYRHLTAERILVRYDGFDRDSQAGSVRNPSPGSAPLRAGRAIPR